MDTQAARLRAMQWAVIGVWICLFALMAYMDFREGSQKPTGWNCGLGLITAFAHGAWISLDLKANGRRVGAWRFAAFFLGPLTIWFYMAVRYRLRALWKVPVSIAIYLIPMIAAQVASSLKLA